MAKQWTYIEQKQDVTSMLLTMLFFVFKNQKINMVTTLLNCKVCFFSGVRTYPLIPLFVNRELAVRQCLPRNTKKKNFLLKRNFINI